MKTTRKIFTLLGTCKLCGKDFTYIKTCNMGRQKSRTSDIPKGRPKSKCDVCRQSPSYRILAINGVPVSSTLPPSPAASDVSDADVKA